MYTRSGPAGDASPLRLAASNRGRAALAFLQQDAAELRERLRGQVVQSLEQVLPLQDVKREHAHLAAVGGLDAVGDGGR